ncbi:hypothetical protein K438DRAFT_1926160, partial [Mycena galopus ATCC 62051]
MVALIQRRIQATFMYASSRKTHPFHFSAKRASHEHRCSLMCYQTYRSSQLEVFSICSFVASCPRQLIRSQVQKFFRAANRERDHAILRPDATTAAGHYRTRQFKLATAQQIPSGMAAVSQALATAYVWRRRRVNFDGQDKMATCYIFGALLVGSGTAFHSLVGHELFAWAKRISAHCGSPRREPKLSSIARRLQLPNDTGGNTAPRFFSSERVFAIANERKPSPSQSRAANPDAPLRPTRLPRSAHPNGAMIDSAK